MPRYIDAEKIEYEEHKRIGLGIDYGLNESDTYYTTTKEEIDAIQTADVVERKSGRWVIDEDGNIECSVCGHHGVGDLYCERCGARMDEGEEE